ncbi:hypothetical protein [Alphaentomopoxvirus acuprea]|uniref:Uncharacterized protein n=1 Tax=Alphaentomopoxvirus acuprea TaxID=62099 RepID=W6JKV3_9POXV|nr:hypothetical protein BA82_gp060 [Anomala cuprea entomopoxvirus]BAO49420.1 hypothetical protein [Anomala cuprea entomopoxvirus]
MNKLQFLMFRCLYNINIKYKYYYNKYKCEFGDIYYMINEINLLLIKCNNIHIDTLQNDIILYTYEYMSILHNMINNLPLTANKYKYKPIYYKLKKNQYYINNLSISDKTKTQLDNEITKLIINILSRTNY